MWLGVFIVFSIYQVPGYFVNVTFTLNSEIILAIVQEDNIVPHREVTWVRRDQWVAQPPSGRRDRLKAPVPWVIVCHTATDKCLTEGKCILSVRLIQQFHVESRGWFDIGYNFLVGGDGNIYTGRGWDYVGAHTKGFNNNSVGVAFIGTFNVETPTPRQIQAFKKLLAKGVASGKLDKNYMLLTQRQLQATLSPGQNLIAVLSKWPHYVRDSKILQ